MTPELGHETAAQLTWLSVENGSGKVLVEIQQVKDTVLRIKTQKNGLPIGSSRLNGIYQIWRLGTAYHYASVQIQKADLLPHCDVVQTLLSPINNNHFIAPLQFIAQTRSFFCLFWPRITGGHLFYHLQQAQRFQADRARLYAAELLVALECLHELDPFYYEIKPKNILLDSMGHIVLCDVGLLHLETIGMESGSTLPSDYQAPELLSDQGSARMATTASKWWSLGVFLYEMLTGLPPFYDEDEKERCHKILSEPLEVSKLLPPFAEDLLMKLLVRNPEYRLGAKGAAEIKAHPFFDELDWDKVAQREYRPSFRPPKLAMLFQDKRNTPMLEDALKIMGKSRMELLAGMSGQVPTRSHYVAPGSHQVALESHQAIEEKKEDWELVWQSEYQFFYFNNQFTKAWKPLVELDPRRLQTQKQLSQASAIMSQEDEATQDRPDTTVHDMPNAVQRQTALDAVLKDRYMHLVPTLLKEYSIDLNFQLSFLHATPLEYVTNLGDANMVDLFLKNGADANFKLDYLLLGGMPLLREVQRGNQELVKILVQKTSRVPCTRALGHAVSKQDIPIVNILLAHGVQCDFEDSDRPPSRHSPDTAYGSQCRVAFDASQPTEYMPPLVRAVVSGDVDVVRLLVDHGANVNIGYHDTDTYPLSHYHTGEPVYMVCGRPIQLAMELEFHNIVQLLLESGADINLAQPVWQHHNCQMVPRPVYLQIMSRLKSAAELLRPAE